MAAIQPGVAVTTQSMEVLARRLRRPPRQVPDAAEGVGGRARPDVRRGGKFTLYAS